MASLHWSIFWIAFSSLIFTVCQILQITSGLPATLQFVRSINVDDFSLDPNNTSNSTLHRGRQDEFENVAQIISGVLGGGIGGVFEGSSNFIGDSAVQQEVQLVLKNVAPSLDIVLKYGFDGLKQYFRGFASTTTVKPVATNQTLNSTGVTPSPLQPGQVAPVSLPVATPPPVVYAPPPPPQSVPVVPPEEETTSGNEDGDEDGARQQ